MNNKTCFELDENEIKARAALTRKEQIAVNALMAAVKALPKSLCINIDDDPGRPTFTVSKRITRESARQVAWLRKKSVIF
jgi:hypothetical protein